METGRWLAWPWAPHLVSGAQHRRLFLDDGSARVTSTIPGGAIVMLTPHDGGGWRNPRAAAHLCCAVFVPCPNRFSARLCDTPRRPASSSVHHSMLAIAMVSSECDSVHRRSIAMHRLACAAVHTVCVLHLVDSRGCAKMRGQFHCAPSPKSMPKIRPQEFCQGLFVHCPYSLRRTPHLQCACPTADIV